MDLDLYPAEVSQLPPIHRLIVHDPQGRTQFAIAVEKDELVFSAPDTDITDALVRSKEVMTGDLGIESLGSFISGVENRKPLYRHFLSIYFDQENGTFVKKHITLETQLERMDLTHSLLLAAEIHTILTPVFTTIEAGEKVTLHDYPLLKKLFDRNYNHDLYQKELASVFGANISEEIRDIVKDKELISCSVGFTTVSGAIIAMQHLKGKTDVVPMFNHMAGSSLETPGTVVDQGRMTWWVPFTKNRMGKLSRAIATTLITLNYAKGKQQQTEQTQQNIAYKYHELLEIMSGNGRTRLQTNVGYLVCTMEFSENLHDKLPEMMEKASKIIDPVKEQGTAVLRTIAKHGFDPIDT